MSAVTHNIGEEGVAPKAPPAEPHPMDPRRGRDLSPKFAAILCWLLDLPPITRPMIVDVAVSGECVLVATDQDPFFNTMLGDWRDLERNLREWGAVCEADAETIEAVVRKARDRGTAL